MGLADGDLELVDGLAAVTVVRRGEASGVVVPHALRRQVRSRELNDSGALASDVAWHLPAAEMPFEPRPGDAIVDGDGARWTVLAARHSPLAGRWRCRTRNLVTAYGLNAAVDIERASFTKSVTGEEQAVWETVQLGAAARIERIAAEVRQTHDRRHTRARYRVFVADGVSFDHTCRLKEAGGRVYAIRRVRKVEGVEGLVEIEAELVDQ